jgi:uncharacterized membrane protein
MFFAKLHPLLVHFPVGLLVSGAVFELYGKMHGDETVATAGWFNIRLGFVCALVVMAVGFLGVMGLEFSEKSKPFLSKHLVYACSTVILFALALIAGRFKSKTWARWVYCLLIFCGLLTIVSTGFYGGELVHGFGIATLQPVD